MTPLTDDALGELLGETFTAHEHLADLDRAVELAASPGPSRHPGRVLLGAAAAVVLVAGGTSYVVSQEGGAGRGPVAGPSTTPTSTTGGHQPPLPPLQTDAANQAAAVAEADRVATALAVYPGGRESDQAGVPQLDDHHLSSVHPAGHTVVRSRFWTVSGVTASAVAHWYAAHPPVGFVSGGRGSVGGQGDGSSWIYEVSFDEPGFNQLTGAGTAVELQTTTTPAGVGVRATVSTVWLPARPATSFVQDVSSIDVRSTHHRYGRHESTTHRSFTVSATAAVLNAARMFNDLPGLTPLVISCPMMQDQYVDRIAFHTATGEVTAVSRTSACGFGMIVRRNGQRVEPELGGYDGLLTALGVHHFGRG